MLARSCDTASKSCSGCGGSHLKVSGWDTGIFYFLTKAGAVSALPAHLMSDHVFLGSALVAMLSAESVLLARDIRYCLLP